MKLGKKMVCFFLNLLFIFFVCSGCTKVNDERTTENSLSTIRSESRKESSSLASDNTRIEVQSKNGPSILEINDEVIFAPLTFQLTKVNVQDFNVFSSNDQKTMESLLETIGEATPNKVGLLHFDITNTSEITENVNLNIVIGSQIDPMLQYQDVVYPIYLSAATLSSEEGNFTNYFDITIEPGKTISIELGYPLSTNDIGVPLYFYPHNTMTQGLPAEVTEEELQDMAEEQVCYTFQFNIMEENLR